MRVPPRSASGTCRATAVTSRPAKILPVEDVKTGVVLPGCEPGEEPGQGDPVGGEGIRGQSRPCQPGVKGEDLASAAVAQQRPLYALPGGGPVGAQDAH